MPMNKGYTKSGDDGFTSLANGKRIKKTGELIELYGNLDELNSFLGYAAESLCYNQNFNTLLKQIYGLQNELFEIGASLISGTKFTLHSSQIGRLEDQIDAMSLRLPILHSFILPGGGESASRIHLARAVCRRAERVAFKLSQTDANAETVGVYLNRLSNWLYAAARTAALIVNAEEMTVVSCVK